MAPHDDTPSGVTPADTLRWEPRSLSSTTLDRVLLDALSDLYADAYRQDSTLTFRERHFRERLEHAVFAATGISLCGLPNTIRRTDTGAVTSSGGKPDEQTIDKAVERFTARYLQVYSAANRQVDPDQAHDEAVHEGVEAVLFPENTPVPLAAVPAPTARDVPVTRADFESKGPDYGDELCRQCARPLHEHWVGACPDAAS